MKKNKVGGFILSIIKILWYQHKNKQIDEWNRTESRYGLTQYGKLPFYNGGNTIQWRKDNLFQKMVLKEPNSYRKEKNSYPSLHHIYQLTQNGPYI